MERSVIEFCSHFEDCNVNDCPLIRSKYKSYQQDKRYKCKLSYRRRKTILRKYNMALKKEKSKSHREINLKSQKSSILEGRSKQLIKKRRKV